MNLFNTRFILDEKMRFVVLVIDHTSPFNIDLRVVEHTIVFGKAVVSGY
mgnify:CR=1 FL=1